MDKLLLVTILVLYAASTRCRPDSGDENSFSNGGSKAKAKHDDGVSDQIPASKKEGPVTPGATANTICRPDSGDKRTSQNGATKAKGSDGDDYSEKIAASAKERSVISDATSTLCQPDSGDKFTSPNGDSKAKTSDGDDVPKQIAASEKEGLVNFDEEILDFDVDFEDIDLFDFEEDALDAEEDTGIEANDIPPSAWAIILEKLSKVAKTHEFKDEKDRKSLEKDIVKLKEMEEILAKRGEDDFGEDEPDKKIECATLETHILKFIQKLNQKDQDDVMDIDGDGIPDFPVYTTPQPHTQQPLPQHTT